MNELHDHKAIIAEELRRDNPDWRLIERLSREEVDADPASVRFSVDAGHIQRLGFELVAKQDTALAELIKNSYDADATRVTVGFSRHDKTGGDLVIEDNGTGMSLDVVRDTWMRISTANKNEAPISPRYGRFRAGRKGIGRFAVQRLGSQLVLESEVRGNDQGIRVSFDWDEKFHSGLLLYDVFSKMTRYDKPVERERTSLQILGLRESWSEAMIDRAWRAVLLLQPPFPISCRASHARDDNYELDPGFEVVINGISSRNHHTRVSIKSSLLDHALAEISGEVLPDGTAVVRVHSNKYPLDEQQVFDNRFLLTGPVSFSAKYFIYQSDAMSGLSTSLAAEIGRNFGGIRIYRNGFRVPPYGDQSDDWLRLDLDVGRRKLLPAANNRNFYGQVELDVSENPLFEETSSREGLLENEAFEELRLFMRSSLEWAVKRVAFVRGIKQTAGQKNFVSNSRPRKPSEVINKLMEEMTILPSTDQECQSNFQLSPQKLAALDTAKDEIIHWEMQAAEREAALLRYEEMLRVLASLGLSISIFGHEIKGAKNSIAAHLAVFDDVVEDIVQGRKSNEIQDLVASFKLSIGRMFDLGAYIDGVMSSTESRELKELSIKGAVERFVAQFRNYMMRQGVEFEIDVSPDHLRTIKMHASEIDSTLLNFLTNAIKSMKRARVQQRRVRIFAREDGDFVLIGFEDNGEGVPQELESKIFDAFFTTTLGVDDDAIAGPGTGLGLKIISDIAASYGGSVNLGSPSEGYNCCLEFRILSAHARRK